MHVSICSLLPLECSLHHRDSRCTPKRSSPHLPVGSRAFPDGQHDAPAPVVGALPHPHQAPRPEQVQGAVRPDHVGQEDALLLRDVLQRGRGLTCNGLSARWGPTQWV